MQPDLAPLLSSAKMDWETPDCVLDRVRRIGNIELDPCTTAANPVGARRFFYPPAFDGLEESWSLGSLHGLVYVNPPYGRELPWWVAKCVNESRSPADHVVLLVPSRTDTAWFGLASRHASARCFWRGRLKFRGAAHPAPFPSAVFYFGTELVDDFVAAFADAGETRRL